MLLFNKSNYWLAYLMALLFFLVFGALVLMNIITQDLDLFERYYNFLLIIASIGIGVLSWIIFVNLLKVRQDIRKKLVGSRLVWRMIKVVSLIVIVPSLLFYLFSLDAISRNIDSLNTESISKTLHEGIELSNASIATALLAYKRRTELLADDVFTAQRLKEDPIELIRKLRIRSNAYELSLFTNGGQTIATSNVGEYRFFPTKMVMSINEPILSIREIENVGSYIEVVIPIKVGRGLLKPNLLLALYPISKKITKLKRNIEKAKQHYARQTFIKEPLKNTFTINATLVFLFFLVTVLWGIFRISTKLVKPVTKLSKATKEISQGNYQVTVDKDYDDDFGDLIGLFNQMTQQIESARNEASEQKIYLETILKYSYGVIALDNNREVQLVNNVCEEIMQTQLQDIIGLKCEDIANKHSILNPLVEIFKKHLSNSILNWDQDVVFKIKGEKRIIACQCVSLMEVNIDLGFVVVFNDITELSVAQRQIAWAEVAKRLAHEIKNPLTPIQLSAERLRKKYLTTLNKKDAEVLDKTTTTIMQQVELLKKMVDAFSQYARSPELNKELLDLNKIVKETLDLYQSYKFINFKMDENLPLLLLDKDSIQRMLINLIKNALEVIGKQENPHIEIETKVNKTTVFLILIDNGGGLDEAIKDNIFEPYVSSKKKGTGLGLAIVKRIVEKHNGKIKIQNIEYKYGMGAKITIQFKNIK
jgi:nitrogen fixation/metabolism regulation signal transduction histidine kinase